MLKLVTSPRAPSHSATDRVFDAMYRAVVQLDLPPGTWVSEAEVAERLQVSRQPVRDAFFRLSNRGFLVIRPQRSTLVTKISEAEVLRAAFIRIALETACIKAAIDQITDDEIASLHELLDAQAAVVARQDSSAFHELDEAFHARLCDIAGHPKIWNLIQEQKGHLDRVRFLSLSFNQSTAHAEHMGILAALEARDCDAATQRMEAHVAKIKGLLTQIRRANSDYFEEEQ